MTVYIDEIIMLNVISDIAVLKITGRLCALRCGKKRVAAAAAVGAVYAAAAVFAPYLGSLAAKLFFGGAVIAACFGKEGVNFKTAAVFFAVSAVFSGGMGLLYSHLGRNMYIFFLSFLIIYFMLGTLFKSTFASGDFSAGGEREVNIKNKNGREAALHIYVDTGNMLKDPVSGDRVMVISAASAACLFSERDCMFLKRAGEAGTLTAMEETDFQDGDTIFAPIFFKTVSGADVMPAFRPEKITVGGTEIDKTVVAVSFEDITLGLSCTGVIGV